ncbi:hypothetical protein AY555_00620 [Haematospirillum jordaniae]|uniref:Uncharacterized protein n=1 Tax=Haematospirillum jordaniae TaxID=1549855 RepID=A0A143DBM8_9PROT|nr:hypothetical protein AY555_00620 [Haematospirillum jordaniae]
MHAGKTFPCYRSKSSGFSAGGDNGPVFSRQRGDQKKFYKGRIARSYSPSWIDFLAVKNDHKD